MSANTFDLCMKNIGICTLMIGDWFMAHWQSVRDTEGEHILSQQFPRSDMFRLSPNSSMLVPRPIESEICIRRGIVEENCTTKTGKRRSSHRICSEPLLGVSVGGAKKCRMKTTAEFPPTPSRRLGICVQKAMKVLWVR